MEHIKNTIEKRFDDIQENQIISLVMLGDYVDPIKRENALIEGHKLALKRFKKFCEECPEFYHIEELRYLGDESGDGEYFCPKSHLIG